jgi:D-3-phosphoglycerate dehydrogenase
VNKVLLAAPISLQFRQFLIGEGYELIQLESESTSQQIANSNQCAGIITSNKLILDQSAIQQYPNLKWIARLGSGMEIIDTDYCDQNRIHYFSSPEGIANSVAEHVIGMLLSLHHKIHISYNEIRNGNWIREENRGTELQGKTIGIVGYGHTGSALVQKLTAFTQNILVYDKYKTGFGNDIIQEVSLEQIKDQADIISFHVPLTEETRYYYDERFISQVKKHHILVNSSRGAVVNTIDLLAALNSGAILGACLDVLDEEKSIHQLLKQPDNIIEKLLQHHVIITPHIAGYSHNAIEKMSLELMNQIQAIL